MLNFIEFILALCLIFVIVPQTPTENILLRKIVETGYFTNYSKAKDFLSTLTWVLIFLFLLFLFILNVKM